MKKKKILTEVFVLFFLAALFMAVYVIIEMGNDWRAVLGGAVVLLIAAYLLLDYLLETGVGKTKKASAEEGDAVLMQRLGDIEDVQKAVYTVIKRGNHETAELLRALTAELEKTTQSVQQVMNRLEMQTAGASETASDELLQAIQDTIRGLRQDYQTGVKNLIKFERENARQIAETSHTNTEMAMAETNAQMSQILECLQGQKEQLNFIRLSTMSAPISLNNVDMSHVDLDREFDAEDFLPVLEDAAAPKEEAPVVEVPTEEALANENPIPEIPEVDIPMPVFGEEDAPVEPPTQKSPEEIADTLQSMASPDPNRALTPEEIAAMFAAVQ